MRNQGSSRRLIAVSWLVSLCLSCEAVYVSYEKPRFYSEGERVPVLVNKLVSPVTLESMDYTHVPLCQSNAQQPVVSQTSWQKAVTALHGDVYYEELALPLYFRRNVYCGQLCVLQPPLESFYTQAIENQFAYQFLIDDLPVAYWSETQDMVSIQYWGGIPLGQTKNENDDRFVNLTDTSSSSSSSLYIYNHYRIEIIHDDNHVLRTTIQPLSIQYNVTDFTKWPALPMGQPMPTSCQDRSQHLPIYYGQVKDIPPQELTQNNEPILFTYDVIWTPYQGTAKNPYLSRWSVFLQMDNGIPILVPLFGLLVAILVNAMLIGVLTTWMLRDLSYKPLTIIDELTSEEEQREAQLWPLSTRVFFKPQQEMALSILCGTGAQWLLAGFVYVFFFRIGMINESLGAGILTAAMVLYVLASAPAGYVSGRMIALFHGTRNMALVASLAVSTILPIVGMIVIHLVYDVLPEELSGAPLHHALRNATPVLLTWLFLAIPLTILGGYFGFTHGPLANFPVSSGSGGYQDLALQDKNQENQWEDDDAYFDFKSPLAKKLAKYWRKDCRLPVLFLLGGLPPLACGFVEYAYGVAGPIFMGYFSGTSFFAIVSFVLFLLCVAAMSVLLFYKQIRTQNYHWWWASFVTGASSGLYIFLLSMSWVCLDASGRDVSGRTMFGYFLWFLYTSVGIGLMTGFVSVVSCIIFSRTLYSKLLARMNNQGHSEQSSLMGHREQDTRSESETSSTGQPSSSTSRPVRRSDDDTDTGVSSSSGDGIILEPKKRGSVFQAGKSVSSGQTSRIRNQNLRHGDV